MPLLDRKEVLRLVRRALCFSHCPDCQHDAAMDYCRTCDEYYWLHLPGCQMYEDKHHGHRLTVVPFVEDRFV